MSLSKEKHLPMYGVGPLYVIIVTVLTLLCCVLAKFNYLSIGNIANMNIFFYIIGIILIIYGALIWYSAVVVKKIDNDIIENHLATDGIYNFVRNPIYTGITFALIGILLLFHNLFLLILPFVFWAFLTILMKCTEEKWLQNLYGNEYSEYCKKVNRCIPFFPKK